MCEVSDLVEEAAVLHYYPDSDFAPSFLFHFHQIYLIFLFGN